MSTDANLTCHFCGQDHRPVLLDPGEKAVCVRCESVLSRGVRAGTDAALVFSITGLLLALPAALLPFISAGISGNERISRLFSGVRTLWDRGMQPLAVVVFLCGGLLPIAVLGLLAFLHAPAWLGWQRADFPRLDRAERIMGHWAIPEVQVLAVLVAMLKLGSVVNVTIGPGFWCYCALALSLLLAQRSVAFNPAAPASAAGGVAVAAAP